MPFWKQKKLLLVVLFFSILIAIFASLTLLKPNNKQATPMGSYQPTVSSTRSPTPNKITALPSSGTFVPYEFIVQFKEGQIPDIKDNALSQAEKEAGVDKYQRVFQDSEDVNLKRFYLVKLKKGYDLLKAIKIYQDLPQIEHVETNTVRSAQ